MLDNPTEISQIPKGQSENVIFVRGGYYAYAWIDANTYYFKTAVVGGAPQRQTLTIKNTGVVALQIEKIEFSKFRGDYRIEENCFGQHIHSGNSCSFDLVFEPKGIGQKDTTMSIYSNTLQSPKLIFVKADAIAVSAAPEYISVKQAEIAKIKPIKIKPPVNIPTKPSSPTNITTCAIVSFYPDTRDGGSPVKQYEVIARPKGVSEAFNGTLRATGQKSPIKITGLDSTKTYNFTVRAQNSAGYSAESDIYTPGSEDYVRSCE